jgi:hypothetical protein
MRRPLDDEEVLKRLRSGSYGYAINEDGSPAGEMANVICALMGIENTLDMILAELKTQTERIRECEDTKPLA